mmetsp:Transcript_27336/g.64006  ORF Transcript_27336/g.64006 Transcript_27336/m.64006 type:complete len:315 (-) Transcript_27336:73-1017(-)
MRPAADFGHKHRHQQRKTRTTRVGDGRRTSLRRPEPSHQEAEASRANAQRAHAEPGGAAGPGPAPGLVAHRRQPPDRPSPVVASVLLLGGGAVSSCSLHPSRAGCRPTAGRGREHARIFVVGTGACSIPIGAFVIGEPWQCAGSNNVAANASPSCTSTPHAKPSSPQHHQYHHYHHHYYHHDVHVGPHRPIARHALRAEPPHFPRAILRHRRPADVAIPPLCHQSHRPHAGAGCGRRLAPDEVGCRQRDQPDEACGRGGYRVGPGRRRRRRRRHPRSNVDRLARPSYVACLAQACPSPIRQYTYSRLIVKMNEQ